MFGSIQEAIMKEMVWSNSLNRASKYIIPLLDDNLVKEDICVDTGFVNAYTEDVNRPWHSNNIFLLYKVENTYQAFITFKKLTKLDTLKTWYPLRIKGKSYRMFVFQKCNSSYIKELINVGASFGNVKAMKSYIDFWKNFSVEDVKPFLNTELKNIIPMKYITPLAD